MIDFCGNMCTPFAHEFKGSSIMIKKKNDLNSRKNCSYVVTNP